MANSLIFKRFAERSIYLFGKIVCYFVIERELSLPEFPYESSHRIYDAGTVVVREAAQHSYGREFESLGA